MKTAFEKMRQNRAKLLEADSRVQRRIEDKHLRDSMELLIKMKLEKLEPAQRTVWLNPRTWF